MFPKETHILIVDDSDVVIENVRASLEGLGYNNITQAEDGALALSKMQASEKDGKPVQLVISDWNMPNMTGIEFLRKVRATTNWVNLPFILLTAVTQISEVVEAITAGVSTYIVKPVDPKVINEKMEAVWKKHFPAK